MSDQPTPEAVATADALAADITRYVEDVAVTTMGALQMGGTPDQRAGAYRMIRDTLLRAVITVGERLPDDGLLAPDALHALVDSTAASLVAQYRNLAARGTERPN